VFSHRISFALLIIDFIVIIHVRLIRVLLKINQSSMSSVTAGIELHSVDITAWERLQIIDCIHEVQKFTVKYTNLIISRCDERRSFWLCDDVRNLFVYRFTHHRCSISNVNYTAWAIASSCVLSSTLGDLLFSFIKFSLLLQSVQSCLIVSCVRV